MTSSLSNKTANGLRNFLLLVIASLTMAACSTAPYVPKAQKQALQSASQTAVSLDAAGYVLGAGDVLRVIVFGDEQLSGEFTIDASGRISLPLIQDVEASGHNVRELETIITDKLQPEYLNDPKVSVQVIEYRSVYILGEVRLPGKYQYVPNMTLLQAIAVAGGHTYRADENGAEISRQIDGTIKKFNVRIDTMIMPGDTVVIKRRWF